MLEPRFSLCVPGDAAAAAAERYAAAAAAAAAERCAAAAAAATAAASWFWSRRLRRFLFVFPFGNQLPPGSRSCFSHGYSLVD